MSIYVNMMKSALGNNDVYKMKSVIQSSLEDQKSLSEFNELLDLAKDVPNFWDQSDQTNFPKVNSLTKSQAEKEFIEENAKLPDDFSHERVAFLKELLQKNTSEPVIEKTDVTHVQSKPKPQVPTSHTTSFHSDSDYGDQNLNKKIIVGGAVALSVGVIALGVSTTPLILTTGKVLGVVGGVAIVAGGVMAYNSKRR